MDLEDVTLRTGESKLMIAREEGDGAKGKMDERVWGDTTFQLWDE